jgi:hypothetical protein
MLTRLEREQAVVDLHNQGKTIRDIAKEIRMSLRDIGSVLKKEEEKERQKRQLENNTTTTADSDSTQPGMSLSTQAYKLFSQGKSPVEVAIKLDLRESEVTEYYKGYWKLKGLHELTIVYEEIKSDIKYFLELYGLSKAAAMSTDHVITLLKIANSNLPALENRYEKLRRNVDYLESKTLDSNITLEELKSQIQNAKQMLDFYHSSCQKKVSKMLQLHRQNIGLERLLRQFKNNNEDYIRIEYVAKQTVRSVLSDNRQLLKLALLSLIESLSADPIKFNFLIHGVPPLSISKSTIIDYAGSDGSYHTNSISAYYNKNSYAETLTELIVNESASLYEKMVNDFANQTMTNAAAASSAKLLPSLGYSDEQNDTQKILAYRHRVQTSVYDR